MNFLLNFQCISVSRDMKKGKRFLQVSLSYNSLSSTYKCNFLGADNKQ